MMENMIGEIARTMQSDRRAQAMRNEQIAAAMENGPDAAGRRARAYRAAVAKALVALATRLAPPAPEGAASPTMMPRTTR